MITTYHEPEASLPAAEPLSPRDWPLWAWALLTVLAHPLGYELTVGAYTFSTGAALMAGCTLGTLGALRSQALAFALLVPLSLVGIIGEPSDWGYMAGRIAVGAAAGRLAVAQGGTGQRRTIRMTLLVMGLVAAAAASAWEEPWIGQQLKPYFNAVLILAMVIAFFYALRLVEKPTRVLTLTACLAPYYLLGLGWTAASQHFADGAMMTVDDLVFYGYVMHLPGDVLMAVVVAFLSGPKHVLEVGLSR